MLLSTLTPRTIIAKIRTPFSLRSTTRSIARRCRLPCLVSRKHARSMSTMMAAAGANSVKLFAVSLHTVV